MDVSIEEERTLKKWDDYIHTRKFHSDLEKVLTAHEMEREEVTKTDEWKEFHDILIEKGDIPEQLLPLLPALEVIFELKCINFLSYKLCYLRR